MPARNALEIKERILSLLRRRGPSLPVHIAKETGLSILFAGAFLSELVADKQIKFTDMKVGSSPIYFLKEHAYMLEKFSQHLNSREKEAFLLLRDKKFLRDEEQSPVIRVALREIKDFAIPLNISGKIIWRYYLASESEFSQQMAQQIIRIEKTEESPKIEIVKIEDKPVEIIKEEPAEIKIQKQKKEQQEELGIFDSSVSSKKEKIKEVKEKPERRQKSGQKAKKKEKKKTAKKDENFFNKVKDWVIKNSMEILDIESFNKNELFLKIKNNQEELLLVAYNKKRFTDVDLIKAGKRAREKGLKYLVISLGDAQRKMIDLIDAAKNLSDMKKID